MSGLMIASQAGLWIMVIFISMAVLGLYRQVGVLHLRFGPRGALDFADDGPPAASPAPTLEATTIGNSPLTLPRPGTSTGLVFLSTTCPMCEELIPSIPPLSRSVREALTLAVLVLDDYRATEEHLGSRLDGVPVVASPDAGKLYNVPATPYAILIDADGNVSRKGIVNTLEQLEHVFDERGMTVERQV